MSCGTVLAQGTAATKESPSTAESPASQLTRVDPVGVKAALGDAWRITRGDADKDWGQALSPDGKRVAFFTFTNFHPTKHLRDRNRLTICSADGTERWVAVAELRNKAETMFCAPRLIWSQDSSMLYLIFSEDPWGQAPVRILKIDVAGRKLADMGTAGKEWNYYLTARGPGRRRQIGGAGQFRPSHAPGGQTT